MKERALQKLIDKLWELHAHPDRHGYKDWMSPDGFDAAIRVVLKPEPKPKPMIATMSRGKRP